MMEHRKMKFALFGNVYQSKKSAAIQQVLSTLADFGAEVFIDQEYYDFLCSNQHVVPNAVKVFSGDDFDADFVISMGGDGTILKTASMISIRASINGQYLNTYQADGLVISTPTGSTAYSLSNGGPIIVPGTKVFSMTAVAPHSLNVRPIVLADSSVIELDVESRSHSFLVAIDGRSEKCKEGTKLTLRRASYDIHVVKRPDHRYFNALREKMMWGVDAR